MKIAQCRGAGSKMRRRLYYLIIFASLPHAVWCPKLLGLHTFAPSSLPTKERHPRPVCKERRIFQASNAQVIVRWAPTIRDPPFAHERGRPVYTGDSLSRFLADVLHRERKSPAKKWPPRCLLHPRLPSCLLIGQSSKTLFNRASAECRLELARWLLAVGHRRLTDTQIWFFPMVGKQRGCHASGPLWPAHASILCFRTPASSLFS